MARGGVRIKGWARAQHTLSLLGTSKVQRAHRRFPKVGLRPVKSVRTALLAPIIALERSAVKIGPKKGKPLKAGLLDHYRAALQSLRMLYRTLDRNEYNFRANFLNEALRRLRAIKF